jgi:hypothetical protein
VAVQTVQVRPDQVAATVTGEDAALAVLSIRRCAPELRGSGVVRQGETVNRMRSPPRSHLTWSFSIVARFSQFKQHPLSALRCHDDNDGAGRDIHPAHRRKMK